MTNMNGNLHVQLGNWVNDEISTMLRDSSGILKPDNLKMLCKGPMVDIWEYMMKHVHLNCKVAHVKKNLLLNNLRKSSNIANQNTEFRQDIEERDELRSQIKKKKNALNHLLKENDLLKADILNSESGNRSLKLKMQNSIHKATLSKVYAEFMKRKLQNIDNNSTTIKDVKLLLTNHQRLEDETVYVSHGSDVDACEIILEKSSAKKVREACLTIEKCFCLLINQNEVADLKLKNLEQKILKNIEDIMHKQSPRMTLDNLIALAKDSATTTLKIKNGLNLSDDSDSSRPQHKSVGEIDFISKNEHQSVESMVKEKQYEHIKCFLSCVESKNSITKIKDEINLLKDRLDEQLRSNSFNERQKINIRRIIVAEADEAGVKAAFQEINTELNRLSVTASDGKSSMNEIRRKYEIIQNLDKTVKLKQDMIRALLAESIRRTGVLDDTIQMIKGQRKEIALNVATDDFVVDLSDWISRDMQMLNSNRVLNLMKTKFESGDRLPTFLLSIYGLKYLHSGQNRSVIKESLQSLNFPVYKDIGFLLDHIFEKQLEMNKLTSLQKRHRAFESENFSEKNCNFDNVTDLAGKVKQHEANVVDKLVPMLKAADRKIKFGWKTECPAVEESIADWWEQPAQFTVDFVKLDGKTFKEWLDLWTLTVIQLKNLRTTA